MTMVRWEVVTKARIQLAEDNSSCELESLRFSVRPVLEHGRSSKMLYGRSLPQKCAYMNDDDIPKSPESICKFREQTEKTRTRSAGRLSKKFHSKADPSFRIREGGSLWRDSREAGGNYSRLERTRGESSLKQSGLVGVVRSNAVIPVASQDRSHMATQTHTSTEWRSWD